MGKPCTGQALTPGSCEEAGLKDADILLAVTDRDEVNLVACLFANVISLRVRKVALIRNPDYTEYRGDPGPDLCPKFSHYCRCGRRWPAPSGNIEGAVGGARFILPGKSPPWWLRPTWR
jgi:hypothetical protein